MTRLAANIKILNSLSDAVHTHPDWRFGQILFNLKVIENYGVDEVLIKDPFHEESVVTLKRICDGSERSKNADTA